MMERPTSPHRGPSPRQGRRVASAAVIALLLVLAACGGSDDPTAEESGTTGPATTGPATTSAGDTDGTGPGATATTGLADGTAGDEEADFEVRVTDVFEPEDDDTMTLVGVVDAGTLRPTDAFTTSGSGTSTYGVVLRIDRVTQPLDDDVEEAEAPSGVNLVVTVDDPDAVTQGQVLVPRDA